MSIHDDTTNNFIQSITNVRPHILGVTRHLVDGEWYYTWSDMTWWDYQKWNSVQDEHRENANRQYVQMTVDRGVQLLTNLKMDLFVNKVGVTGFSFGS